MSATSIEVIGQLYPCDVYISVSNNAVDAAIIYAVIPHQDGDTWLGAYYGSVGSGEYDGGFFRLDIEQASAEHLDYDDVDGLSEENELHASVLNALMQKLWTLVDDSDGEDDLRLTDAGRAIYVPDDSGIWMSDMFDGDSLDEISHNWKLPLTFDS